MNIEEVKEILSDIGIVIQDRTLRRKADTYILHSLDNKCIRFRDMDKEAVYKLALCLALESLNKTPEDVKAYLVGNIPKYSIIQDLTNNSKIHGFLRSWIENS